MSIAIDGKSELVAALDALSSRSVVAAAAPRGTGLFKYLEAGVDAEARQGDADGPFWRLTVELFQGLSIWWHPGAVRVLPVMTPWCVRDRSARYDQGPEMWGSPRADGYFRDDNSIIKKLPLPLLVDAREGTAFARRKPRSGFTACHIWRDLEDGTVGGTDPWVYSFMPNLVWVPTALAPLTDHAPRVMRLLHATSRSLFADASGVHTEPWTRYAWNRLAPKADEVVPAPGLDEASLAMFRVDAAFVGRRLLYIDRFVDGATEVLTTGRLSRKLVSSRYSTAMPTLDADALGQFRDALATYADAVRAEAAARPLSIAPR